MGTCDWCGKTFERVVEGDGKPEYCSYECSQAADYRNVLLLTIFFLSIGFITVPFFFLTGDIGRTSLSLVVGFGVGLAMLWCTKNSREARKAVPRYSRRELVEDME